MAARKTGSSGRARAGSPRRGHGYPVKPKWQADVKARLVELGMDVKDLALAVKCAQSTMHDTLNKPDAKHSSLVPAIHKALGWEPPAEPEANPQVYSPDALEMAGLFDMLPESMKKSMRDQARAVLALVGKTPSDEDS